VKVASPGMRKQIEEKERANMGSDLEGQESCRKRDWIIIIFF